MELHTWAAFAVVAFVVSIVPGPAFAIIVGNALGGGARRGLLALTGVVFADLLAFALAALGLGALLQSSPPLFLAAKWIGASYLALLGIRALLLPVADTPQPSTLTTALRHPTVVAISTQFANPKFLVFLAALVPPFVDVHRAAAPQFAILGTTFAATDALVYGVIIAFVARARRFLTTRRARIATQRATGLAMLGAATRVAL